MYRFPQLRWSFSNVRQLMPTTNVSRGVGGNVSQLRRARSATTSTAITSSRRSAGPKPMTWKESLSRELHRRHRGDASRAASSTSAISAR
jgi:hypothetical protein